MEGSTQSAISLRKASRVKRSIGPQVRKKGHTFKVWGIRDKIGQTIRRTKRGEDRTREYCGNFRERKIFEGSYTVMGMV